MITKGIVESIISKYSVKVRLPILDGIKESKGSVPTNDLSEATICTMPNGECNLSVGDVVFVGFEDNDIGRPVVLGCLYREVADDLVESSSADLTLRKLTTTSTTSLSEMTSIGIVKPEEIKTLSGARFNIQNQLDNLDERIDRGDDKDIELGTAIEDIRTTITEANLDNLVTKKGQDQEIESNKTFKGNVVIDSCTKKNEGGLLIKGTAANHPLRVRGISGIDYADATKEGSLYLNYDGVNDLEKYLERPVYLGGADDSTAIAVRQDMLQNEVNKAVANLINESPDTLNTLREIAD